MTSLRWWLRAAPAGVGALLASVSALLIGIHVEPTVAMDGEVQVRTYRIVRAAASGRVADIHVRPGGEVSRGELLVSIANPESDRQLLEARRQHADLGGRLERLHDERQRLIEGEHADALVQARRRSLVGGLEVAAAVSQVEQSALDLAAAQRRLERDQRLAASGLLSVAVLDERRLAVDSRQQAREQRRLNVKILEQQQAIGERQVELLRSDQARQLRALAEQLEGLVAQQASVQASIDQLAAQASSRQIRAEIDGVVIGDRRHDHLGRWVQRGDPLLTLIDPQSIGLQAKVPEEVLVRIRPGQPVKVEVAGLPRRRFDVFDGRIGEISPAPEELADGRVTYPVTVTLDRPWVDFGDERFYLRAGMRGRTEVAVGRGVRLGRRWLELLLGRDL